MNKNDTKKTEVEIKELKAKLKDIVDDFDIQYYKSKFNKKAFKIKDEIFKTSDLSYIFSSIKKYFDEIENSLILHNLLKKIKIESRQKRVEGILEGYNFLKIKNTKKQSYNWFYYLLFREMLNKAEPISIILKKSLEGSNKNALKKELNNDDFIKLIKEIDIKEIKKLLKKNNLNAFLKPKIYKKYFKDFHKSILKYLNEYELVSIFSNNFQIQKVEPLIDKWQDLTIKFYDEFNVKLIFNNKEEDSDYMKLGFADKRKDSESNACSLNSWKTLIIFSVNDSKVSLYNITNKSEKESIKKNKKEINIKLKSYFNLKDDPILYDEIKKEYFCKIKLIPSSEYTKSWNDRNIYEDKYNNKHYLNNH